MKGRTFLFINLTFCLMLLSHSVYSQDACGSNAKITTNPDNPVNEKDTEPHTSYTANGLNGAGKYGTGWNFITAREQGSFLYEVFSLPDDIALHYLFYTMNQLSNHFSSFDEFYHKDQEGNNDLITYNDPLLLGFYNLLGNPPNTLLYNDCSDVLLNYAIRVTSTFLYWLSVKTGLIACPEELYLQNNIYYGNRNSSNTKYKANSRIYAGNNVRADIQFGDIVHTSGSLSEYIAKDEIVLKDGFISESGSNFHAFLSEQTCNLDNYEVENKISSNPLQNFGKKNFDEISTLDSVSNIYSIELYILDNALFYGDTLNYLKFDNSVYKAVPSYKFEEFNDSGMVEVDHVTFLSDTVYLYHIDTLLNTELIQTLVGNYLIEMNIDSTVITKIDTVQGSIINKDFEIQIFPNPSNISISIDIELNEESEITVIISDERGNIIKTLTKNEIRSKGVHNFEYNLNSIPQGNYLIGVYDKKKMISKRFIKLN